MATTQADLDALIAARNSGALRVSVNGRQVEYRSITELNGAIQAARADLEDALNAGTPNQRTRRVLLYSDDGF